MFIIVSLFLPQITQAQFIDAIGGPSQIISTIWDKYFIPAWKRFGAVAYKNAINLYLGQMAKETAEWVAAGAPGKGPLFITDKEHWNNLNDAVLGTFIDSMAKDLIGQSLCDPFDPTFRFKMLISLDPLYKQQQFTTRGKCSFSQIKKRLGEARQKKLFAFDLDIRQGAPAKYKSNLSALISQDTSLNKVDWPYTCRDNGFYTRSDCQDGNNLGYWANDGADTLLALVDGLSQYQTEYQEVVEYMQNKKGPQNNEYTSAMAAIDLKKIEKEINDYVRGPKDTDDDSNLSWWQARTPICAAKTPANFCDEPKCMDILDIGLGKTECSPNDGIDGQDYAQRANTYVKQLNDWASILEQMIKETKPSEEELEIPDLSPLEDLNRMYSPEGSDIGVILALKSKALDKQTKVVESSKFFQSLQGRMNDLTTRISGITKTPSIAIKKSTEKAVESSDAGIIQFTGVAVADAFGIFANTLMSKLLERVKSGWNPNVSPEARRTDPFLTEESRSDSPWSPTTQDTKAIFADLTVAPIKRGGEITIYDEFTICPSNQSYALPTNCLLDDNKLLRAVEDRLTIQQAMDSGLLDAGTTVGQPNDYTGLLSLPNVKKLRRARIFSLGLEIAAQKIFDSDPSLNNDLYTLKEIIDGFSQFSSTGYCPGNININGGFKDKDNDDTPDGWSFNRVCGSGAILNNNNVTLRTIDGAEYAAIRRTLFTKKGETYTLTFDYSYQQPDQNPPASIIFYCPIGDNDCQDTSWQGAGHSSFQFTSSNDWISGKIDFEANYDNEFMRILISYGICLDESANPISCSGGKGCQNSNFGQPYSPAAILNLKNIKLIRGKIDVNYEPASPFCRLVDPNWVLKASTYQCETIGYSAVPVPNSTQRQETCVDLKDCINE
ncbi:hypothetical protein IID20_03870, partial [Patescibacteria group bacterium]|nr:hypothetical protein [Patescibacteria group bacterium]